MFTTPFGSLLEKNFILLSLMDGILLGGAAFWACYLIFWRGTKDRRNVYRLLLFAYAAALVSLTLPIIPPWAWSFDAAKAAYALREIEWRPFAASLKILRNCQMIGSYRIFIHIVGGNFVMLMPLGILVPLLNRRFRLGRMAILALGAPVAIEALQLFLNIVGAAARTVEIDDVILNAAGCMTAYLLLALARRTVARRGRHAV